MTNQRADILKVARSQIGYKEGSGNWTKYGQWYGVQSEWCAMFVSWCANQAKIPTSIIPKLAYVPYEYDFFVKRKQWRAKGSYRPQGGDLIIFGENDHIGIVEQVVGNNVITIEGNTSNNGDVSNGEGVYRRTRPLNYWWIKGYCVPAYKEEEEVDLATFKNLYNQMKKEWQDNDATNHAEMAEAREWAKKNNIITGTSSGVYSWQDIPTREQLATMLYRFAKMVNKA